MRRLLRALLFAALALSASQAEISFVDDAMLGKLVAFNRVYEPWAKKLLGCEGVATVPNENVVMNCRIVAGEMDYSKYKQAREAAKKLFDLVEPTK